MKMKTRVVAIACLTAMLCMSGCAMWQIRPAKVVLLPEERIFTVPAGQKMAVMLDKKPMEMVFPEDMKLVSPTVLVRQEEKLNNALLDKVKADKNRNATIAIITAIFGSIAGIIAAINKFKKK